MSKIAMENRGKRPRFFPSEGTDETVSMMLELMSEVWVMRERMYALEQVIEEAGLPIAGKVEAWEPDEAQFELLQREQKRLIQTVLRSTEANHVPGLHLRRSLDAAAEAGEDGEQLTEVVRAA